MALINCPECGREISDQAASCPNCGSPVKTTNKKFCKFCGEQIDVECVVCPKCGKQIEAINPNKNIVINNSVSSAAAATSYAMAPKPREKESPIGIIGLIFSFIFCFPLFPLVGLILCFISLFHKKHTCVCGIIGVMVSIITLVISCVLFAGGNNNNTVSNNHRPAATASSSTSPRTTSAPAATPGPTATPEPDTYITLDEFNLIEVGMSYAEVVEIVGCDGTLMSTVDVMGITTSMYSWYGKGGIANANVMFEGDAVVSKGQFGLD